LQDEYHAMIDDLGRFLRGRTEPVVARLQAEMLKASDSLEFEKAAALRDQLVAIERVVEKQKVITTEQVDSDVIAFARADGDACVQVFFIRAGKLIGREYFVLEGTAEESNAQIVEAFVKQFYDEAAYVPQEVLLPEEIEEARIINEWLNSKRSGDKVALTVPRRGMKKELIEMAAENAADTLATLRAQWEADASKHVQALSELKDALGLQEPPNRIECFDISNTQGTAATASMVTFEQGAPKKAHYRRFIIKSVEGPNDFASMKEALTRRFRRWKETQGLAQEGVVGSKSTEVLPNAPARAKKADDSFAFLPDLLIVDGGKGQLGVAVEVLKAFGLDGRVPVCGLAKQQEEIFLPERPDSLLLPRRSQGLFLVQRVRDEAHRFALTHHRNLRGKRGIASQLDSIPGIGPARRKALLRRFGSLDGIRDAALDEIASVPGMSRAAAEAVKASL
jgi:excinuclease ABC subunit C